MGTYPTVTAFMLAKGQGDTALAERAFRSVPKDWARLLVVQDSPDAAWRALAKAERATVRVVPFETFSRSKNAGLDAVETDWVFVLDSDEALTPALIHEITAVLDQPTFDGYEVPRANSAFGKVVRHGGWYPDYQLKLFRPSLGRYAGDVHELIQTTKPLGQLKNDLLHENIRSLAQYHAKIDHYTSFEAEILHRSGRVPTALYLLGKTVREFLMQYIWRQGYRDGIRGLVLAGMSSYYRFLAGAKVWERWYAKREA